MAALPDDFRNVLVAVDVAGLSYREAARALRIRNGTVMSRLFRARRQLVSRLEGGAPATPERPADAGGHAADDRRWPASSIVGASGDR